MTERGPQSNQTPVEFVGGLIDRAAEAISKENWLGWDEIKVTPADIEETRRLLEQKPEPPVNPSK